MGLAVPCWNVGGAPMLRLREDARKSGSRDCRKGVAAAKATTAATNANHPRMIEYHPPK